jgi:hypothetical protein
MAIDRYKWDKNNKCIFSVGLMRKGDSDIIEYLETKTGEGIPRNTVIKQALRLMMAQDQRQDTEETGKQEEEKQ